MAKRWIMVAEYISEIVSFVLGMLGGSLLTFTLTRKSVSNGGTIVDQGGSTAQGDIIGGNKSTVTRTERK